MGLLIWTAYGVYAGQNAAIQSLAAKVLQLDLALADYGPAALSERRSIRESLRDTIEEIWDSRQSDTNFVANNFEAALSTLRKEEDPLENLHPSTDKQTQDLAAAKTALDALAQARLQVAQRNNTQSGAAIEATPSALMAFSGLSDSGCRRTDRGRSRGRKARTARADRRG